MNSLTRRLLVLTTLWVALGLGLMGWFVVQTDQRQIETTADARLGSLLDAVVAGFVSNRFWDWSSAGSVGTPRSG